MPDVVLELLNLLLIHVLHLVLLHVGFRQILVLSVKLVFQLLDLALNFSNDRRLKLDLVSQVIE